MARLALMVLIICLAIPLTVQRSCTLVSTGRYCLKECCGSGDNLYCLDSCVGHLCSTSLECDSSCCRNGRCTTCPTTPPKERNTSPKWWIYVLGAIILIIVASAYLSWKYWWVPRLRRLAAPVAPPANITVLAVINDEAATVPPPYKP